VTSHVSTMFLRDARHGGPAGQPQQVANRLATFVNQATTSLDIAIYDFRLNGALADTIVNALTDAANRGVAVRIAFDAGKPATNTQAAFARLEADPAPVGTADWIAAHFDATQVKTKAITAPSGQLMHSKYLVRDAASALAAVWTGSANFTDDAWTLQENNVLTIASQMLAQAYLADFNQLWDTGSIKNTGVQDTGTTRLGSYRIEWDFAPGDGASIDAALVTDIAAATRRIVIAAMVLTSHPVLAALASAIDRGIPVSGIYDGGQMGPIVKIWRKSANNAALVANWEKVAAQLAVKHSTPYTPTSKHDFLHHKVLVIDNVVVTGSYNFSANAQKNAENQLRIGSSSLATKYATQLAAIAATYGH